MTSDEEFFRLPAGGQVVRVNALRGSDELLLAEATTCDTILAMKLAERLTCDVHGARLDWGALPVTDLDAFIIFLRRRIIGNLIRADVACQAKDCGQRIDVVFRLDKFIDYHAPSFQSKSCRGWTVELDHEPGWLRLAPLEESADAPAKTISFRLPTPVDQIAVNGRPDAEAELARRCLEPLNAPLKSRRKAEAVMEAMAPCLSCDVTAVCPECETTMMLCFEARRFCLSELCDRALSIYADVDVLARAYHWSESKILSLPRSRRAAYVNLAMQARSN